MSSEADEATGRRLCRELQLEWGMSCDPCPASLDDPRQNLE